MPERRRARNWFVLLVLFFLLGVPLSLLHSWVAIAVFETSHGTGWTRSINRNTFGMALSSHTVGFVNIDGLGPQWYVQRREDWNGSVFQVQYKYHWAYPKGSERLEIDPATLPEWSVLADLHQVPTMYSDGFGRTIEQSGGWPFRSWYGRYTDSATLDKPERVTCIPESTIVGAGSWDDFVIFPYDPVFPGVIYNAAFFGWGLLLFGGAAFHFARKLKRYRRILNRRCANCNYDVRTLDACPECGEPRPARYRPPRSQQP